MAQSPPLTRCDLKHASEAKLLFKEKDRSKGLTNNNFKKVCAVVGGIPQLNGIVDDVLATIDGTIKGVPLYEETVKKLEREDVTCTELLEASECLTSNQDNIRKELALELCEPICRKIHAAKHRFLR